MRAGVKENDEDRERIRSKILKELVRSRDPLEGKGWPPKEII